MRAKNWNILCMLTATMLPLVFSSKIAELLSWLQTLFNQLLDLVGNC